MVEERRFVRPTGPHQMPATVEVMVLEMRRSHPYWGARRIAYELARKQVEPAPSESAVYRSLVLAPRSPEERLGPKPRLPLQFVDEVGCGVRISQPALQVVERLP